MNNKEFSEYYLQDENSGMNVETQLSESDDLGYETLEDVPDVAENETDIPVYETLEDIPDRFEESENVSVYENLEDIPNGLSSETEIKPDAGFYKSLQDVLEQYKTLQDYSNSESDTGIPIKVLSPNGDTSVLHRDYDQELNDFCTGWENFKSVYPFAPEYINQQWNVDIDDAFSKIKRYGRNAKSSKNTIAEDGDIYHPQDLKDVQEWLGDINPNFDAFDIESPYCNNCGSCAWAVFNRLNGNTDMCATAENIGYNDEMNALTGMEQVSMSPEEIERRLLDEGDGAHAIIGIDRADSAGHWFNAACIDGKVVAIDGQTNEIYDWPPDYGDVVNWEMSVRKDDM